MTDWITDGGYIFFFIFMYVGWPAILLTSVLCWVRHKKKKEIIIANAKKEEQKRKFLESLEKGTWEFDVAGLRKLCDEHNIRDVSTEANIQRVKLLVAEVLVSNDVPTQYHKNYTSTDTIKKYFKQIEKLQNAEQNAKLQEEIQQTMQEEATLERAYTRYAEEIGREKCLAICRDRISECDKIIAKCNRDEENIKNAGNAIYEYYKQHESSWAIHGGIAEGIAGPAAGVAVASDVANRNQNVRSQNAALSHSIAELEVTALLKIGKKKQDIEKKKAYWEAEKQALVALLSKDENEKALLGFLHPTIKESSISKTGAIHLTVNIKKTDGLIIYDTIQAVVDGSFKVLVKVGNKTVGYAICVIPYGGSCGNHDIKCICRKVSEKDADYHFEFVPYHLWEVEAPKCYGSWQK